jgi:hypothetical protein
MKLISKYLSIGLLIGFIVLFNSCEEEDNLKFTQPEAEFVLNTPAVSKIFLNFNIPSNPAFTLNWTDEVTGSNSYTVQMSPTLEFENPIDLGTSESKSFTMSVEAFNNQLSNVGIESYANSPIFMRVLAGSAESNSVLFTVNKYPENQPVISSPDDTFSVVLTDVTEDETALTVEWTDPDFSEENTTTVNYIVEASLSGNGFVNVANLGETNERTLSFTHGDLNENMLNIGAEADVEASVEIRIRSVIDSASGMIERTSEVITISVTPYETALPATLWGVGAGMPDAGWGWGSPEVFPLQGSKYSGNVNLSPDNGGNFRFFLQEDWGPESWNYPYFEDRGFTFDSDLVNANDGDSNFQFIGTAGEYFLEIDMDAKTITLSPPVVGPNCNLDQLYLVGAGIATAGWNWDNPTVLSCTGNGTYSGNVELVNDTFRFFLQPDWGPDSYNFPYYVSEGYTIDPNFEDALDGDNNFRFTGTPGNYFLTVDDINKTITLGPPQQQCDQAQLWLVGAGIATAGWSWDTPTDLPCTGNGVYSGTVELANDAFRFFLQPDWGPDSYNFPYFVSEGYTIDPNFEDAQDGDNNFSFIGTPGTYTLTLDTVNKTITLQ